MWVTPVVENRTGAVYTMGKGNVGHGNSRHAGFYPVGHFKRFTSGRGHTISLMQQLPPCYPEFWG